MKKALAITTALALCLSIFSGCAGSGGEEQTNPPPAGTEGGNLWAGAQGKEYTVGTDTTFAPFEFENEAGEHTGIDIVLLESIAAEMGFKVKWDVLGFTASVAALEASQVQAVMAGMSITDERKLKYDFTDSYYDCSIAVAVKSDQSYTSLDDLKGKTVVAKTGTTGAQYAEEIAAQYSLEVLYVEESAVMYTYVESGQAEACFEDYPIVQFEISRGNISLKVVNESSYSFPTALAVLKGNTPELIAAFNEGLSRLKASGAYQSILDTYFKPQG
jgi:polar amino acid transport system substrate-binding protein